MLCVENVDISFCVLNHKNPFSRRAKESSRYVLLKYKFGSNTQTCVCICSTKRHPYIPVIPFVVIITKTCPCNVYPLEPHFYIAKLGYAVVYLFLAHLSRRLTGELIVYPCSGVRPSSVRPSVVRPSFTFSKIFSSETAWPIKAKLYVEHP